MKGYPWNHKRVYRIYRELIEPADQAQKADRAGETGTFGGAGEGINQCWSLQISVNEKKGLTFAVGLCSTLCREIKIKASKVPAFKAGANLKTAVNGGKK